MRARIHTHRTYTGMHVRVHTDTKTHTNSLALAAALDHARSPSLPPSLTSLARSLALSGRAGGKVSLGLAEVQVPSVLASPWQRVERPPRLTCLL